MALLRSAGAGHLTDPVVLVRLATAAVLILIWLIGGALAPEAVAVLMAAVAVGAGITIGRAWRGLGAAAT